MCILALPITSVLIDHSVSKCCVREQSIRTFILQIFLTVRVHGICSRGSRLFETSRCEGKNVIQIAYK